MPSKNLELWLTSVVRKLSSLHLLGHSQEATTVYQTISEPQRTTLCLKVDFKAKVWVFLLVYIHLSVGALFIHSLITPSTVPFHYTLCLLIHPSILVLPLLYSLFFSPFQFTNFSAFYLPLHLPSLLSLTFLCVSCPLWKPPLCHILFSPLYPVLIQLPPPRTAESRHWRKWLNSGYWVTGYSGPPVEVNIAR